MVQIGGDDQFHVELCRSGFVDWNEQGAVDPNGVGLVILLGLWGLNWLTHLLIFRGGWTVRVYAADGDRLRKVRKVRYRRKAHALADVERQLELGAAA